MAVWEQTAEGLRVRVRAHPRSSRTRVVGAHGDSLKVQVTAAPVGGAANEALLDAMAEWLAVPRRAVALLRGQTGRDKVVRITTGAPAALASRIESLLVEAERSRPGRHRP